MGMQVLVQDGNYVHNSMTSQTATCESLSFFFFFFFYVSSTGTWPQQSETGIVATCNQNQEDTLALVKRHLIPE